MPRTPKNVGTRRDHTDAPNSDRPLIRVGLAVSLDGYIAAPDGGVKWLDPYFTPEIDFARYMKSIGVTVWGRATFDQAVSLGHRFGGRDRVVVLTHRPLPSNIPPGVEAFDGDVRELAERLRRELAGTGKDILLGGGGASVLPFHEAALVDRWDLGVIPVLLGDGLPLFLKRTTGVAGLRLTHSRVLSNGIVELRYEAGAVREKTSRATPRRSKR